MSENSSITPEQAMLYAEQQQDQGDFAGAERTYRQLINASPNFHPAYHSLGLLAFSVGKPTLAVELVAHAIALDNTITLYHSNLCEMLRQQGRLDEAIAAGNNAIGLDPKNHGAMYNLGLTYVDAQQWDDAIKYYQSAIQLKPDHGLACNNLGSALENKGKIDEALEYYKKAIRINPQHSEAQNNLGAIYSERGMLDEARNCFSLSIQSRPDFIEPYQNISSLKTFTIDDPQLDGLRKLQGQIENFPLDSQTRYYFSLGKALEDISEYDNAFKAYSRGNQLQFMQVNVNESVADNIIDRVQALFPRTLFENWEDPGCMDETPVFIVGMPRSGTTLIEQTLASNQDIYGAGELKDLHEVIISSRPGIIEDQLLDQCEPGLPGFDFPGMAGEYLQRIRDIDSTAKCITDKMPANFFYIGFIHLMFPKAKIIHSMRDPMNSCFSCYSRLFNETMEFAYNLQTLGNYYRRYMKIMQHWHSVLPSGTILDVNYEDVVADHESQARRMIEYVGLPWDDDCLEFYKNKRLVKTASVAQVRKPIYKSSLARWQHFEKHLGELRNIVEPYRPENLNRDIEQVQS